ncbi:hypothetical protein ACFL21_01850 [Patescibacteria group bacterium]
MLGDKDSKEQIKLKGGSRASTLFGILLILGVVAAFVFYSKPLSQQYGENKETIGSRNQEIETLEARIAQLKKAQTDLDLTSEVQRLEVANKIPNQMLQDDVIRDIVNISEDNKIILRSLSFGKGSSGSEGLGNLRINASFEGDYGDLMNFLRGIETNKRFFKVGTISVQINPDDISGIQLTTFTLSMESFYREDIPSLLATES